MADIVDIKTFFDIKKIPEEKFVWFRQRPHRVRALQIPTDFEIENWQGVDRGKPGDYLVIGENGKKFSWDKELFERTYTLDVPPDTRGLK